MEEGSAEVQPFLKDLSELVSIRYGGSLKAEPQLPAVPSRPSSNEWGVPPIASCSASATLFDGGPAPTQRADHRQ